MVRLNPDQNDILVWRLNEQSGSFRNTGTLLPNNSSTDLVTSGTFLERTSLNVFGEQTGLAFVGLNTYPVGASSTRNYATGANSVNPSPPITVSCWIYLRAYTTTYNQNIIAKDYRDSTLTNSWATPFVSLAINTLTTNGGGDWAVNIGVNNTTNVIFTVTDFPIPLYQWCHIGFTHDGTNIRVYLNGCPCMYYTSSGTVQNFTLASAAPSYTDGTNGNGGWRIGSIPATGSANREEPNASICDVRVANIVRNLEYFQNVYRLGVLPIKLFDGNRYYKLRAYDMTCETPTPVVWIDTQVSLLNAPVAPCSGTLTDLEILETWIA